MNRAPQELESITKTFFLLVCHYPSHLYSANLTGLTLEQLGCGAGGHTVHHNLLIVAMLCLAILAISFSKALTFEFGLCWISG